MAQATVRVEGLRDLRRDLRRIDRGLDGALRDSFRSVAGVVVEESQSIAERKGLRDTGALIRGIKSSVTRRGIAVRSTAERKGFLYPAVYEFGLSGNRAFLSPAIEAKQGEVIERLEDAFEDLASRNGFRGSLT